MNITHNIGNMAKYIPITFELELKVYSDTLYQYVWRADGVSKYVCNTEVISKMFIRGIQYMIEKMDRVIMITSLIG